MAEKIAAVEAYLTCPVCLETFKEPVTLGCNHSFCSSCLHNFWDQNNTKNCPVCRRKSSKDIILVNFALKELCISFSEKQKSETQTHVCSKHPEVPPLFCKEEARALCPVCEFSQHDRDHTVVSLEEAETELKEQLRSQLQALKKQRGEVETVGQAYKEIQQHSEKQAEFCERQIRAVFSRLHQFLKEEEESQLTALREEQQRQAQTMGPELERIRERLSSLSQSIQDLENQLDRQTRDFLLSYRPAQSPQPLPQMGTGLLINQAKVLGNLGFRVWRKMRNIIQFSPVVLDPNTAHRKLHLSEDLTSVRRLDPQLQLQLPDNPERFSKFVRVLGSEGFSSGTHQWDVEVGDHPLWAIGVVKESVDRKGKQTSSPENGFWRLRFHKDKYSTYNEKLNLKTRPQKIRIQLDYSRGTVSFCDSRDLSLIYTHKATFTEKLFPFFCVRPSTADCQTKDLRICQDPGQVQV